jgi:hypothetical protein
MPLSKYYYIKTAADIALEHNNNAPAVDNNETFLNLPLMYITLLFSAFIFSKIMEMSKNQMWDKINQKWDWKIIKVCQALFVFILGSSFFVFLKVTIKILDVFLRNKMDHAEKVPFIVRIPPNKSNNTEAELRQFLKSEMFYSDENADSIISLYNSIKFNLEDKQNCNLLISGLPGVGKTEIFKKIAKLMPNGAIMLKLSAILKYKDINKVDMTEEIKEMNDLIETCTKEGIVLCIDDSELLLGERGTLEEVDDMTEDHLNLKKRLMILIGVWRNYWLSILSCINVPLVLISNEMHSINGVIDPANARRIQNIITIALPKKEERLGIWKHYLENFIFYENTDELFSQLVDLSDGFSGRDIEKICYQARKFSIKGFIDTGILFQIIRDFSNLKNEQLQNLMYKISQYLYGKWEKTKI